MYEKASNREFVNTCMYMHLCNYVYMCASMHDQAINNTFAKHLNICDALII